MSSSRNFLLRYAPDCTFSSRKMKKLLTVGGGHPPPAARSLRSLGLGRFAPSQRLRPKCFGSIITPLVPPPPPNALTHGTPLFK